VDEVMHDVHTIISIHSQVIINTMLELHMKIK